MDLRKKTLSVVIGAAVGLSVTTFYLWVLWKLWFGLWFVAWLIGGAIPVVIAVSFANAMATFRRDPE